MPAPESRRPNKSVGAVADGAPARGNSGASVSIAVCHS